MSTRFDDLYDRAMQAGWSQELWDRIVRLRPDRGAVEQWLDHSYPPPDALGDWATDEERFFGSTLQRRLAVWSDNDLLADIYAGSPESVGEWQVTVEHEPYAFSQQRLQEYGTTMLIEDQREGMATISRAIRQVVVGDVELSVMAISGMRVHQDHQGKGLSGSMIFSPGLATSPFASVAYWYARRDNSSAPWLAAVVEAMEDQPDGASQETHSSSATILHLELTDDLPSVGDDVRSVALSDLDVCAELVNRTNDGLDLAPVASRHYLRRRLNTWGLGALPDAFDPVYTEDDYFVLERDGRIVACAGLWDRGRNLRERWEHRDSGETRLLESGAVLDYGYAEDHAGDMAVLLEHLAHRSASAGRTSLMLPIEHDLPLLRALGHLELRPETRDLMVMPFAFPGLEPISVDVRRPATDLAYW